jgi:hypothetical protein
MPNLAQKYEAADASEYILKLMADDLYKAGQRVKFSARVDGRYLDHKYLIRMCGEEVFLKQKASPPQPTFISIEALQLSNLISGGSAFAGIAGTKKWCDGYAHKNGSCICDPYNNKSPPPSVYLDTRRYNGYIHGGSYRPRCQGDAAVCAAAAA